MSTVHVVPLHDTVAHEVPGGLQGHDHCDTRWLAIEAAHTEPEGDCPCGVRIERVPNEDGPDGWLVVHHSLDGREASE